MWWLSLRDKFEETRAKWLKQNPGKFRQSTDLQKIACRKEL